MPANEKFTINPGWIVSSESSDAGYIKKEANIKDSFNIIEKIPISDPGAYKIRIRRMTDSTVELSSTNEVYVSLSRSNCRVPIDNNTSFTQTELYVVQGMNHNLSVKDSETIGAGEWRVSSVTTNNITTASTSYIVENGRIILPDIVSLNSTIGTRTINLEIKTLNEEILTPSIVQNFTRSSLASDIYNIAPDSGGPFLTYGNYSSRNYLVSKNGSVTKDLYYTITASNQVEASGAAQFSYLIPAIGTGALDTAAAYYTIKVYDSPSKTTLLAEHKDVISKDLTQGSTLYRRYARAILYAATGYSNTDSFVAPMFKNQSGTLIPALIARTAFKFESSSKINGKIDGINGIVQTVCLDYDAGTDTWISRPTNNPASLFLHVLLHPANAYRIPLADLTTRVNINGDSIGLKQWHIFCTQNNLTYNNVIDRVSSVMDVLRDIAAAGRASPTMIDGKWGVVVDKPRTDIVQHFTPHNSWGFEGVRIIPRTPDAFRTVIRDESNGYLEKELIVYNEGFTSSNAEVYEEISLPGVTNRLAAVNHLRWHLAQSSLRHSKYTINTDVEYIVCNRGDRVKVAHDVPSWGVGSGRIKAINGTEITLEEDIDLSSGTVYSIRIRKNDGTSVTTTATVSSSGITNKIDLSSSLTGINSGDLLLIGTTSTLFKDLVVLSIEPLDNKNARITLTDYAEEIYSLDLAAKYPSSDTSSNNYLPPDLAGTIGVYPKISSIQSDISVATQLANGLYKYNMVVNKDPYAYNSYGVAELPDIVDSVEVQYVTIDEDFSVGRTKVFSLNNTIILDDVIPLTQYKIRIRYYSSSTGRVGLWGTDPNTSLYYYTHIVASPTGTLFDRLEYIDVDLDRTNLLLTLNRTTTKISNFSHYEIRVLKDMNNEVPEDFWSYMDDPNNPHHDNIISITTMSEFATVNLLNFPAPRFDADGVLYRIACRSVDNTGNSFGPSFLSSYLLLALS